MCCHVVGSLLIVQVAWIAIAHQFREIVFQIRANIAVRIFSDNQRGTGMMYEHMAKSGANARLSDQFFYPGGDIDSRSSRRFNTKLILLDHRTISEGDEPYSVSGQVVTSDMGCCRFDSFNLGVVQREM